MGKVVDTILNRFWKLPLASTQAGANNRTQQRAHATARDVEAQVAKTILSAFQRCALRVLWCGIDEVVFVVHNRAAAKSLGWWGIVGSTLYNMLQGPI